MRDLNNEIEVIPRSTDMQRAMYLYIPHQVKTMKKPFSGVMTLDYIHLSDPEDRVLILRPLKYLIDNVLEDGNEEAYSLNQELCDILNTNDCSYFVNALINNLYYALDIKLWILVEHWLSENHFDWKYDLINKGLAIPL